MEAEDEKTGENTERNDKNFADLEREKEEKLLNLIVEILVRITLEEFYETSDQVSEI